MSVIGFGASPLGNVFQRVEQAETRRAVDVAIDEGINFFDVSPYYGLTLAEERLGEALVGKREKIFLATKVGRDDVDSFDFSAARVTNGLDESLRRLRTDRVDLLQAHDVEFASKRQIVEETLPALRAAQLRGKARFIGITSYQLGLMAEIAESAPIDAVLSYCRHNLLIDDMDELLTPVVRERGIGLINASPLHMGVVTGGAAPEWHPAPEGVRAAGARIAQLCREAGVEPTRVALRFCLDHPYVTSTLIGMSSAQQVRDNLRALDAKIDPALRTKLREAAGVFHNVIWPSGLPENRDYRPA